VSGIWLPEVVGDPAGMRALAAVLRAYAGDVASLESAAASDAASMTFEGPAGDAFRGRMIQSGARVRRSVDQLLAAAQLLEVSATQVEEAQRERERRLEEMRRAQEAERIGGPR
jgi:uncharacterized protein YukE